MNMLSDDSTLILSILIVTFQSAGEIANCLKSIPQTLRSGTVEIIIVDNSSTDETCRIVARDFPFVTLIVSKENLGFSKANNLAFEHARGSVILYLNPDTILNTESLEACLARVGTESRLGILSPRLIQSDGTIDPACRRSIPTIWDGFTRATGLARLFPDRRIFSGYNMTYLPEFDTYEVGSVNGAFMMVSRAVLEQIGLLDERFFMYGEDLDLCYRCHLAGYTVVYDGRTSIIHLKGQSSAKDYRSASRQIFLSTEQFYQKHFNPRNTLFTRWKFHLLFLGWETFARIIAFSVGRKKARPI